LIETSASSEAERTSSSLNNRLVEAERTASAAAATSSSARVGASETAIATATSSSTRVSAGETAIATATLGSGSGASASSKVLLRGADGVSLAAVFGMGSAIIIGTIMLVL